MVAQGRKVLLVERLAVSSHYDGVLQDLVLQDVGLEALQLYEGGLLDNGRRAGARLMAGLESLKDHPPVGDVRGRGMLAAVELVVDKERKTPLRTGAANFRQGLVRAFPQGVLGYAPPLCCTDAEIDAVVAATRKTLDQTLADKDVRQAMA
ncbi:MAG: aminotransferase class III-fold pyridoxal phosphate-dependent enzyme [Mesorhizobium sp.]|nr:aminotransferase class III-fold pyridoxal phosphate-dependent enzyme [Mesorhizobium sp.]TIW14153.1 MAG: aminotransferase class III-fold pyridoxal phosphate-dependent enzyme [Mesorhizobium sp.]TIX73780.1 MAG: aminotransferase class III-fold pyridoxal phosphate-dependent enzyme [Mesorhizobium sp.]